MDSDQLVESSKTNQEHGIPSKSRLKCGRVADLVNLAEIQICGPNNIGTTAFAEGIARLGDRSASRLGGPWSCASTLPEPAACVYHWFTGNDLPPFTASASVVLVAGSHQQAVDHCLIAQRIAGDLRIGVHCLVDSSLQECLGCVELPPRWADGDRWLDELPPESVDPGSLAACFESACDCLQRVHRPIMSFGPEEARQVLIACGREAVLARTLLDHGCLSAETRLLQVQLLKPFPDEQLLDHLLESDQLIFVARPDDPVNAQILAALEVLAAGDPNFPEFSFLPLPGSPPDGQDLLDALPDSIVEKSFEQAIGTTPQAALRLQIGVIPAGRWSQEFLVESVSTIRRAISPAGQCDSLQFRLDESKADSIFSRLRIGTIDEAADSLDLLVYTENTLLDAEPALKRLKQNGTLILNCESPDVAQVWHDLPAESKRLILDKHVETWWIRPRDMLEPGRDIAIVTGQMLNGALLKTLSAELNLDNSELKSDSLSVFERAGAQAVRKFDPCEQVIGPSQPEDDVEAMATDESEALPGNENQWRGALRAFHLTGSGAHSQSEPLPGLPLWPALATKLSDDCRLAAHYPLILPSPLEKKTEEKQHASLFDVLQSQRPEADSESPDNHSDVEQIVRRMEKAAAKATSPRISEVAAAFTEIFSENGDEDGDPDTSQWLSRLPESARLVGFGPDTLARFYCWALAAQRKESQNRFYDEVQQLIVGLQEMLQVDLSHREKVADPQLLTATMGEPAAAFVDVDKLSENLPDVDGSEPLPDELLLLSQETARVLQAYMDSESRSLPFYLITSGEVLNFAELPSQARFVTSDCFEAALGLVDGLLQRMARVFRAVRVARLLISRRYQPEIHDEVFSRFEWQSCNDDEILLGPSVLVVESSAGIKHKKMEESLNRLLRSGRPIHILITQNESSLIADELSGTLEDLSAIAMANREAFVLQTTLVQPDHLLSGLREMVQTARPSIAFVSSPPKSQTGSWAWASQLLSHYGRQAPCFRYSPDHGPSWSHRIDISGNPQPEAGQAIVSLTDTGLPPASEEIVESVTFAHAASLWPEFRSHFRVIPRTAWSDDQQQIGAYLDEFTSTPPATLPYIWIVRDRQLCRAIMTREMANACRDRGFAWKSLQELALIQHEIASKSGAPLQDGETAYHNETERARAEGRKEGTVRAVHRIVEVLLGRMKSGTMADLLSATENFAPTDVEVSTPTTTSRAPTTETPAATTPQPEPPASTGHAEPTPIGEAYIDTELCTSCNDCLKINPLLFVYDANNQAEIGDPMAGTFTEMVKAAEKCPARCIHPGAPREDDDTATPAMIKRASKFQ